MELEMNPRIVTSWKTLDQNCGEKKFSARRYVGSKAVSVSVYTGKKYRKLMCSISMCSAVVNIMYKFRCNGIFPVWSNSVKTAYTCY